MTQAQHFDVLFIGGGPAGYVGAIRAAQLGLTVACVDARARLGGTCLNVGCIPSKALLHATARYAELPHLADMGIAATARVDLPALMAHKDGVVQANGQGIDFLLKKNGVTKITGAATIAEPGVVAVDGARYTADAIVIATGSVPAALPGITVDEKRIVTSTGALALEKVPKRLAVIGAGAIGLEMGSIWARLGARVEVIEFTDAPLPGMDGALRAEAAKIFAGQGLEIHTGAKVTAAKAGRGGVAFTVERGGTAAEHTADVLLVAVGRRPHTQGLGLEALGIELDARGFIPVDAGFATAVEGIYAIGDCIPGPMLAHKAEEDGVALAEILAGEAGHVDYALVPAVVYTEPEVASVGATEEALKERGVSYRIGTFPFMASGRARAMGAGAGFVKLLADAGTDRLLGAHIIGPQAGELIATAALCMAFEGSAEDLARTCHAHPTLAEAVKEAALAACGLGAIHA
jgi:dihydrolipoamide dehydrogenase